MRTPMNESESRHLEYPYRGYVLKERHNFVSILKDSNSTFPSERGYLRRLRELPKIRCVDPYIHHTYENRLDWVYTYIIMFLFQ